MTFFTITLSGLRKKELRSAYLRIILAIQARIFSLSMPFVGMIATVFQNLVTNLINTFSFIEEEDGFWEL